MAYDVALAALVREIVSEQPGVVEKKMFGGLAFLVDGHLGVTAGGHGGLMLRVDPADADRLLQEPLVRPMVMRGRELDGWLLVDVDARVAEDELRRWVELGVTYARSLPARQRGAAPGREQRMRPVRGCGRTP